MVERKIGDKVIRVVRDDITDMEVEAFVYDLTSNCKLDSGYGGAIAVRGGKTVQEELDKIGELPKGEAVITAAGKMKAKHIVHANGPKFLESDTEGKLTRATESALQVAKENGLKQLAFPPMGTGLYQVPLDVCTRVMVSAVVKHLQGDTSLEEVILVGLDSREYEPWRKEVEGGK